VAAPRDIVIIGGGHNALVAAFYLAKAGLKPLVLERRDSLGGAASTAEIHPGFRCSAMAHSAGPLLPRIAADMQLSRHGLEMMEPGVRLVALDSNRRAFALYSDVARSAESLRRISSADAEGYARLCTALERAASVTAPLLSLTPLEIEEPAANVPDLWKLLQTGRSFRKLGKKEMFRLLRWPPMAVADFVSEFFESELARAAIAARGNFGTAAGPWSAGTAATLLLRAAADPHPAGPSTVPKGGMGALGAALAAAAREAGAEIRNGASVAQILVKDGAVTGVALDTGEEVAARSVASSADPKRTFLGLLDPVHLEPFFLQKVRNYRSFGCVAKINLALSGLPDFPTIAKLDGDPSKLLIGRLHIGDEIDYLERAFDASKYGEISEHPVLEVSVPSLLDPALAPAGKHVMSIYAQFAPYKLKLGASWEDDGKREELLRTVLKTLSAHSPNLQDCIEGRQVITPLDLERDYGLTGGHIFHGELALDQLFTMRPVLDWARYRAPIRGLYLCGSGTHPGTGLTGASGANAAREILRDLKK
jgi:phytoene dehydrogenase-like protein